MSALINLSLEVQMAQNCAQGLRSTAAACSTSQNTLKVRLLLCAEQLEKLASLVMKSVERIEVLDGALQECAREMEAWDLLEDRTSVTRAALARARRALAGQP